MRTSCVVFLTMLSGCWYATRDRIVVVDDRTEETRPGNVTTGIGAPEPTEDPCEQEPIGAPTPTGPDTDGDGLSDADEIEVYHTLPEVPDTDVDGLPDGHEVTLGTDPLAPDTDGDQLLDGTEVAICTDPLNPDTDGDGLNDGDEIFGATDPLRPDSDGDGLSDGDEVEAGTDPRVGDSDGDGISDGDEVGSDTDPLDPDSDDDDLSDGVEDDIGTDPLDPDTDDDGLTDGEEDDLGTDPTDPLDPAPEAAADDEGGTAKWAVKTTEGCGTCSTAVSFPSSVLALAVGGLLLVARRRRILLPAVSAVGLTGCYHQETTFAGTDAIPVITSAYARCYLDAVGPKWSFGITVFDADGIDDVIAVEAAVADGASEDLAPISILELYELPATPEAWYREIEPSPLDCGYDAYVVQYTAFDHLVASDSVLIWADGL